LYLPVSQLCKSATFERFVMSIVMNADRFVRTYNRAVATQPDHGNTNKGQRVRTLEFDERTGRAELPFWLLAANGERMRPYAVQRTSGRVQIWAGNSKLGSLNSSTLDGRKAQLTNILSRPRCRLRPKAVPLTLFVRLFLADWFVHGVGGARYEHITDHIIADFYGIKGLSFGIVTANINLGLPDESCSSAESARHLRHKLRYLKFNPEKFVPGALREKEPAKSIIAEKLRLIKDAKHRPLPAQLRRSAWRSISEVNDKLLSLIGSQCAHLKKRLAAAEGLERSKQIADQREYFFGLFCESRLRQIVHKFNFMGKAVVDPPKVGRHCHENGKSSDSCPASG